MKKLLILPLLSILLLSGCFNKSDNDTSIRPLPVKEKMVQQKDPIMTDEEMGEDEEDEDKIVEQAEKPTTLLSAPEKIDEKKTNDGLTTEVDTLINELDNI